MVTNSTLSVPRRRIIGSPHCAVAGALADGARALCVAVAFAMSISPALAEIEAGTPPYELGRGLRLGDSGVTLGGYLTGEYQRVRGQAGRFRSSHASVFFWWEGATENEATRGLKLFGELDHENTIAQGSRAPVRQIPAAGRQRPRNSPDALTDTNTEQRLTLQRLYLDWRPDEGWLLRGGKFLTPVGRWNLAHAGPLVWTTSRPLVTQQALPQNVTGLLAQVSTALAQHELSLSAYASNGREWRADPLQDPFAQVRGGRMLATLALPVPGRWQAGVSWARYEQLGSRGEKRGLLGADLQWAWRGWEISLEALHTETRRLGVGVVGAAVQPGTSGGNSTATPQTTPSPSPTPSPAPGSIGPNNPVTSTPRPGVGFEQRAIPVALPTRGSYVQAVAPIAPQWSLVARVEWLRDTDAITGLRQSTLGLTWRPVTALALKAEYQWPAGRTELAPRGWLASASVLF